MNVTCTIPVRFSVGGRLRSPLYLHGIRAGPSRRRTTNDRRRSAGYGGCGSAPLGMPRGVDDQAVAVRLIT